MRTDSRETSSMERLPESICVVGGNLDVPSLSGHQKIDLLKNADVVMIPVGGFYTIDAAQAKEIVSVLDPRVVIPMHYRSDSFGYPVIGRLEEFTKYYNNIVTYESNTLVLDDETKNQTAVLSL